jgi:hypothetical protein
MTLGTIDTTWYHVFMAMTLRLSDEQTEALRRKAEAEHRSMQQVALAAIDAYVRQTTPVRRQAVPVSELMALFADLPPMSAQQFRADLDQVGDGEADFDAYERARQSTDDS